jgi:hypothetical protein
VPKSRSILTQLVVLGLSLFAGLITTVLVVTILVLLVRYERAPVFRRVSAGAKETPPFLVFSAFGSEYVMPMDEQTEASYIGSGGARTVEYRRTRDASIRFSWSRALKCEGDSRLYSYEEGRGWPFKALRSYIRLELDDPNPRADQHAAFGALKSGEARWTGFDGHERTLTPIYVNFPSEVVPLGFTVDVLVFGAMAYVFIALVRRWAKGAA